MLFGITNEETIVPETTAFTTPIDAENGRLAGPWRMPKQMLSDQSYDDHSSIHDDETARKLGFQGGTIEGPTHFSQFAPLAYAIWGEQWFGQGCLSVHYRAPVYEGERVQATIELPAADGIARITMEKEDGTEVLAGTASLNSASGPTELDRRLAELRGIESPVLLEGLSIGARDRRTPVSMAMDQKMGHLYPFTLAQKLDRITEPSPRYAASTAQGRSMLPLEMVSVLLNYAVDNSPFYRRGPVVGLFADQEIRLIDGPLFVDEAYEIDREVVGLSGSKRTESLWVRTRVYRAGSNDIIATSLLNLALLKESYERYDSDRASLYPARRDLV